jgi:acetyltransferase-like isoleucine patch superfamily enzyme
MELKVILKRMIHSRFVHFFTNTPLLGNFKFLRGNKLSGRYNMLMLKSRISIHGKNNRVEFGDNVLMLNSKVIIYGTGSSVKIGADCIFMNASVWITGDGAEIDLRGGNVLNNCEVAVDSSGGRITLGKRSLVGGYRLLGLRPNRTLLTRIIASEQPITIGTDCLISDGVTIRTGDNHDILDSDGRVINPQEPVSIGDRCWVTSETIMLKGAGMGDDSILAASACLTRDFSDRSGVILAGVPAKIVRENITWKP